ncbi:IclR family transcriptional regulator [Brevundimonas sp. SORGH_AS_0993]|uniref:IclR family transcriptional regulator n=1 Tax=Brevundimonas sp. SORGH_AS_0993 TaxID=3041794 RepID=UPI0027878431|nr:helix-turn-helix domain-containing protein [Brevundimonas sp. SORGH_AS_0993]MDQ1155626.1 DNA-binding IclR family transcriptional regulator [Brevundimonas sp. SORGH_AS_0993]
MADTDLADDRKYRAPALEKGLDVLELLSAQGEAMTPSQMSATLGRSVSELFRMIQVLEFRGYIEQSSDGYRLTNRLFTLGMSQAPIKSLVEAALPVMRDLASSTMQSCHLVVPSADQIVVIARIESPGDLGYSVRIGYRRSILHATSGLMFYARANARTRAHLHEVLVGLSDRKTVDAFAERSHAMTQGDHVERASDFVSGVTDLVAPIMGADDIIATLITPFIEQAAASCTKDEAAARLVRASAVISEQMGAVSQV